MGRRALYPTDPKPCAVCGAVFSRNQNERPAEFFKRQTCGVACGLVLTARSAAGRRAEFAPKSCATCGQPLVRHSDERSSDYRTRKTCGLGPCRDRLLSQTFRAETGERWCAVCGVAFTKREGEKSYAFNRRKTCGPECAGIQKGRSRREGEPPIPPRSCVACGELLVRHDGEAAFGFLARKTCGHGCGGRLAHGLRVALPHDCEVCGQPIERRADEAFYAYRVRRTCSPACKNKLSGIRLRKPDGDRWCVVCGTRLERKSYEKTDAFARRRTCDLACGSKLAQRSRLKGALRQSPYPLDWSEELRDAIRDRDTHCCRLCGALPGRREHHVHHIDYVKANIDPSNLVTLCPHCHSKTNTNRDHWRAVLSALVNEERP